MVERGWLILDTVFSRWRAAGEDADIFLEFSMHHIAKI